MTMMNTKKSQILIGRTPSLSSISRTPSLSSISIASTVSVSSQYTTKSVRVPPPSKKLYTLQLKVLTWSAAISISSFLFFSMNIYAFVSLMTFACSVVLTAHTAWQYLKHLVRNGEILKIMPEQTRRYISEASLHDVLIDATSRLYHRETV